MKINFSLEESDLIFIGTTIERNNGKVSWNEKEDRIDISYKDKKISIWLGNDNILINKKIDKMGYRAVMIDNQLVIPKAFFTSYLGIKDTYKDSLNYSFNYQIINYPQYFQEEEKKYITHYSNKKSKVTPLEIIDKIKDIFYYFEMNTKVKMNIMNLNVIIYDGLNLAKELGEWAGTYCIDDGIVQLYSLHLDNYLDNILTHEIGHYFQAKFLNDSDFEEYTKLRELNKEFFNSETWERTPTEVFAEDFRMIFNENSKNSTLAYDLTKEELEIFRRFLFRKVKEF